jgi:tetratricopeptide (TPR) repeat protein
MFGFEPCCCYERIRTDLEGVVVRIDPDQIRTRQHLTQLLERLYHEGGWSLHRLAEAAGLSPATVQAVITGATAVPQSHTLTAFVTACGQQPEPWLRARGRVVEASKKDHRPAPGPVNLPFRSPGSFVGRIDELALLDEVLGSGRSAVVHAVHGLGGIGKSTLVAHWAATRLADHTLTWWITADTPAAIDYGLAGLAVALQPGAANQPLHVLRAQAVHWLSSNSGWLLVLDNVNTPGDVEPLLARARGGRILITSRLSVGWHQITSATVGLDVFQPDEATALLARIVTAGRPDADLTWADELCTELGHLPLAVEQAAAYMYQTRIGPGGYLDLLARQPAVILDRAGEGADSERTVARVWRVTMDRFADTPLAGQVLRILAWYAPDHLPRAVLDGLANPARLQDAIGRLAAYNLITLNGDDTLTVHRLVQTVTRTPDPADVHRQPADVRAALHQATDVLRAALPGDVRAPDAWSTWRSLLPHAMALADHAPEDTDSPATAHLFTGIGLFLNDQNASAAIALHQRALDALARAGSRHVQDTLSARNNLAMAYQAAGNVDRAIELYEQLDAEQERILGAEHPNTLASRNNLAMTYEAAGRLRQAVELLERTLSEQERTLGADHPSTLNCRNTLAIAYKNSGDLKQAISLYEQNLAAQERIQGKEHPSTMAFRINLAAAYEAAGDVKRAGALADLTMTDCERVLGADHPYTLAVRNLLGRVHQSAGDLTQAIEVFKRTLAEHEHSLGYDHPQTLVSRNNLAVASHAAGDLGQAIPLFERNRAELERILGKRHPMTLSCQSNLALAYRDAGDEDRAAELLRQTLADGERILGTDHPYVLQARHNLATVDQKSGDATQNIEQARQALAGHERVLGPDHPHTLISRNNLAVAYRAAGDLNQALTLSRQTVADSERTLGADHPSTLEARNNLAITYLVAGDLGRGIPLLAQTLAGCERVLGSEHPLTRTVRTNAGWFRDWFGLEGQER